MTISLLLLLIALGCFLAAAFGVGGSRVNLTALGLAFFVGSFLVGGTIST